MQIADAQSQLIRDLTHGDRLRHMLLHMAHSVQEIAADRLLLRQIEMCGDDLRSIRFMEMNAALPDMVCCQTHGRGELLIVKRLQEIGTYAECNRLLRVLELTVA